MLKVIFSALLLSAACASQEARALIFNFADKVYRVDAPADPVPVPAAAGPAESVGGIPEKKKWTIMVFMNGKNDMEVHGLNNLKYMEMVGSDRNVNIVAEFGRVNGRSSYGNWTGVRRIYIKKEDDFDRINSPLVMNVAETDMGNYKRAVDFVLWAKKNYPAEKYMLILWDHGSGWIDPRPEQIVVSRKGISFDFETRNYIRTREIGAIVREAGGVDILAFDACLMQMAEVLSEVKGRVGVMVGSEEATPAGGFPYNVFLGALAKDPGMSAEKLGGVMVEAYGMQNGASLSALRVAKTAELETRLKALAEAMKEVDDLAALKIARARVRRFQVVGEENDPHRQISFYGDLYSYLELFEGAMTADGARADALRARCAALRDFIAEELVINNGYWTKDPARRNYKDSHGISIYLPPVKNLDQVKLEEIYEGSYKDLKFSRATGWHDFVTYLYGAW